MPSKPVEQLLKEKKIYEVINQKLVQSAPDITIEQAVTLMQENRSGYIVVAENRKVVGVLTETDITQKVLGRKIDWKTPIREVMVREPKVLSPKDTVGDAIDLMSQGRFYHLPLVDEQGELCGVLSVRTLIRFLAEFYPTEVYNLPPNPNQIMENREGG
ncbi:MAG: CBS domain-containing protein [Candidatus Omnitrophica bacterium CG11_big_fil_rev_8_21_14_0_20_45_26]|uniref:CBS domain-containing protein n=1 Tax=Candidatus Abzuiibacterium crystallinum TaxID=1974748 RepID=A0A2H0LNL0_9BACT|nr:MAG: CBS domain-containing protein [Candidatus Omnitrophica bacterium CG11_big_fil_rev_8_21_14_0_20_45_26]PIW65639.1 MAG: CBS domain-containing protein [Candidatus Omnitrophica bacterium CG12_big_fil_rev_8_21_14_0_65_45_16]